MKSDQSIAPIHDESIPLPTSVPISHDRQPSQTTKGVPGEGGMIHKYFTRMI